MSSLETYWPTDEHASECLRTEAETLDEALLLAVHEPVTLLRRAAQTGTETRSNETQLLDELMRPVTDGSAVLIAITGASGVGKSHMVRWLRAQLERHPRREDLVVVSIPKTASLRRVVELILEPLQTTEYEALKRDLASASEQLTPTTAAELLAAALGIGLAEYQGRTIELVRSAPSIHDELAPNVSVAEHARHLIQSPEARELWLSKVILRIVAASLGGVSNPSDRQFHPEDLAPPQDAIGKDLPRRVQAALSFLGNSNGRFRVTAASILQEVLDGALRTVFRVSEALQQKSIQDVVDDIRRQLLEEGKELVLLIEDLGVLSGIQQPLLDIMIAESDEHGRRVRAPIRTAVAVTDGYLAGRQTVLTRAKEQWVVPSEGLGEDLIVQKLIELTGRYLNAARWGADHLRNEFAQVIGSGSDLYAWVPRFKDPLDPEGTARLDAFGFSVQGFALFPFNGLAIRGLAENAMKQGGVWTYNPRAYINEVLIKTIKNRPDFLRGLFPPPGFKSAKVVSEVQTELTRRGHAPQQAGQLQVALFFWAGNPLSLSGPAPVQRAVFDAFSLPWPFTGSGPPTPIQAPTPTRSLLLDPVLQAPTVAAPSQENSAYEMALEDWKPTSRLPNGHARETRNLLVLAISEWLDFSAINVRGQKVEAGWFWLPPMSNVGNSSRGLVVKVASEHEPIPARVVAGLKALFRWKKNGKTWRYQNAESDYAAASALLEPLQNTLFEAINAEAERDLGMIAQAIHVQNLLVGVSARAQPSIPNLSEIFTKFDDDSEEIDGRTAAPVRQALIRRQKSISARSELQEQIRQLAACVQNGNKVMGFDFDRLKRGFRTEMPNPRRLTLKTRDGFSDAVSEALARTSPNDLPDLIDRMEESIRSLISVVREAFAPDHSRVAWRDAMRQTINEALKLAVWPHGTKESSIQELITRLSYDGIEADIQKILRQDFLSNEDSSLKRIATLCVISLPRLNRIACDVSELTRFFADISKLIANQTRSADENLALDQRDRLITSLEWLPDADSI